MVPLCRSITAPTPRPPGTTRTVFVRRRQSLRQLRTPHLTVNRLSFRRSFIGRSSFLRLAIADDHSVILRLVLCRLLPPLPLFTAWCHPLIVFSCRRPWISSAFQYLSFPDSQNGVWAYQLSSTSRWIRRNMLSPCQSLINTADRLLCWICVKLVGSLLSDDIKIFRRRWGCNYQTCFGGFVGFLPVWLQYKYINASILSY